VIIKYRYIKYSILYSDIYNLINKYKYKKIIFYVDLNSISKGFYNVDNLNQEINYYSENQKDSNALILELRSFYNNLYVRFKNYNPFFVTFYDDGQNIQNLSLDSNYKQGRSNLEKIIPDITKRELLKHLKKLWFENIEEEFNKKNNISKVFYLKQYESDLIPYYCISNNKFNSKDLETINIILSVDKDLLQCCQFENTYQITNTWKTDKLTRKKKLFIELYNNNNVFKYLDNNFIVGKLTARYIPLLLSISGDNSDSIPGINGYGIKKTIKLLENNNIPDNIYELKNNKNFLPAVIQDNFDLVINNLKLIDFKLQLERTNILKQDSDFYNNIINNTLINN
jgi:5'-3' exonuclease